MGISNDDCLKQIDNLLSLDKQSWLLGAGISFVAKIPLMAGLTERVMKLAEEDGENEKAYCLLKILFSELPESSHIEHVLNHLGDYAAIAERTDSKTVKIGEHKTSYDDLCFTHSKVIQWIATTVRWGYVAETGEIGSSKNPIVQVSEHQNFIRALFNRTHAGISERRCPVNIFTTNYDTLLEDALALERIPYWDGFTGGAVGFRSHFYGNENQLSNAKADLIKLHGSIDWHMCDEGRIWRVRDFDIYPKRESSVMIYPQATKYIATQRDPFAMQFELLRCALRSPKENVLAICGYSFGDEHINQEIDMALTQPENKTTVIAFSKAKNDVLDKWLGGIWAQRLYVVTEDGIYVRGENKLSFTLEDEVNIDWWTFNGVTKVLNDGMEAFLI